MNDINKENLIPIGSTPQRGNLMPVEEPEPQRYVPQMVKTLRNVGRVYPAFETAANMVSSAYGVPISGLVGLAALPFGVENANAAIEAVQKFLVYQPQTEGGQQLLGAATYPFQKLEQVATAAGEFVSEQTGSPFAGAMTHSVISGSPAVAGAPGRSAAAAGIGGVRTVMRRPPARDVVQKTVERGINKGVRPSVVKKEMWHQRQQYMQNARSAVDDIVKNKHNLELMDRDGFTSVGRLPKTLEEFSQAIEQTKQKIFDQYDALAQSAGRAGASVSMQPIVAELSKLFNDRPLQALSPETIQYAQGRIQGLQNKQFTPAEAQQMIKMLNQTQQEYYAGPSIPTLGKARVDALIANNLRAGLDAAIEGATGIQYQPLKSRYGALRMLESDVTKRAIVDGRKNIVGLMDFNDIFTAAQLTKGLASGQGGFVAAAAATKGMTQWYKWRNDPNQIVKTMFKKVERKVAPKKPRLPIKRLGAGAITAGQEHGPLF